MYLIQQITGDPKQKQTLTLPDGSTLVLIIEYKPMQYGWFISQLVYGSFVINNMRIVTSPNILHQFKNQIPFGLACFVRGNQEPTLQSDFTSNRAQLFLLSAGEVAYYAEVLNGQTTA